MAKQTVTTLHSDVSGEVIPEGSGGGTIEFTVSGQGFAVDLTAGEVEAFNAALEPYVTAGRRLTARGATVTRTRVSAGSGRSKEQLQAIREWATANGHPVSDRGRISAAVLEAFDAAH